MKCCKYFVYLAEALSGSKKNIWENKTEGE